MESILFSTYSFQLMKKKLHYRSSEQENLSIFHNNIRTLTLNLNLENLQSHLLDELDHHFNTIGLTKTKITSNSYFNSPQIGGYDFDEFVPTPLNSAGVGIVFLDFPWAFLLDRALFVITFSVLDIGVIYLWPWV